jgi:protein TonB
MAAAPTPGGAPPRPHPTKAKAQLAPSLPPAADGEAAPSIGPASGTQISEGSADPTAEGSGPRGGTAAASGGVDHAGEDYRALIKQRIQAALVFPAAARRIGLTGQVMVRFLIDAEGRVPEDSLGVVGGAESDLLRDGALRTVKQAMPFPPPPGGGMRLELAVTFNRSS